MAKVIQLTDAIERAREAVLEHKTPECAVNLQQLERQRRELQATMRPFLVK
jgi:hypothetical protein